MARELTVLLLGHFSLAQAGAELTGVYSARLQALLANLLLHRDAPQSRQQLAFSSCWSSAATPTGHRHRLRGAPAAP